MCVQIRRPRWHGLDCCLALLLFSACSADQDPTPPRIVTPPAASTANPTTSVTNLAGQGSPSDLSPQGFGNPSGPIAAPPPPPPPAAVCGSVDVSASRVLPSIMLVVDGSTSMQTNGYPATGTDPAAGAAGAAAAQASMTRWDAVHKALVDPTNGIVPKLQGLVKFGLAVFGTTPQCPLPLGIVEPALNNAQVITAKLPLTAPGKFTPTGPALDQIVDHLPDPTVVGPDQRAPGPQIIVLATDGDPNACGFDLFAGMMTNYQPSIDAALKLQAKHLRMFVISVGQDAAKAHLQEMANIGANLARDANPGATVYYPEDPTTLAMTLATLIGKELSCDVELQGKGVKMGSECKGMVALDGTALECNGPDGWALTDSTHLALKGKTCDKYKTAVDANLHASFPCDAIIVN
jgi:hypothetical protein